MTQDEKKRIKLIVETIDTIIKTLQDIDDIIPQRPTLKEWDEPYKSFKLYFKSVQDQFQKLQNSSKFLF